MPRARLLKPGFFKNEELIELPFEGRLLFAGLWTLADRSGHLKDRPKRIKMELFPADMVDVDALLESLNARGFVHRYTSGSLALIHIPSFSKHQSPHKNEPASTVPACECEPVGEPQLADEHSASTVQEPEEHTTTPVMSGARPAVTGNRYTDNGSGNGSDGGASRHKPVDDPFLEELQAEHPSVNVRDVYARAQNRKTWDGYKDKRRALRDHVGYALADRSNGNGRTRTNGDHGGDRSQSDPELIRLRALGVIHE